VNAPVIGHLPPLFQLTDADIVGAEFEIVGSKDGWLLIRNAEAAVDRQGNGKRVFEGPGWISGGLAGATLGSQFLRAAPRRAETPRLSPACLTRTKAGDRIRFTFYVSTDARAISSRLRPRRRSARTAPIIVRGWSANLLRPADDLHRGANEFPGLLVSSPQGWRCCQGRRGRSSGERLLPPPTRNHLSAGDADTAERFAASPPGEPARSTAIAPYVV
jgi:hypothetical protein